MLVAIGTLYPGTIVLTWIMVQVILLISAFRPIQQIYLRSLYGH